MKLKFLSGDKDYLSCGAKWISKKLNNGDFDYWIVVELINMQEVVKKYPRKYSITISVVSPSEASKYLDSAIESCGYGNKPKLNYTDEEKIEVLHSYGVSATIFGVEGNNFRELWKQIHDELNKIQMLFGFYLDKQLNYIGNTGWDFLKGKIGFKLKTN